MRKRIRRRLKGDDFLDFLEHLDFVEHLDFRIWLYDGKGLKNIKALIGFAAMSSLANTALLVLLIAVLLAACLSDRRGR